VQDIGGGYMGSVDEFLVDSADECITRLVAREGHPGNQKEVTIPISKLHGWRRKQCISNWTDGDLPSCPTRPIRRHWWS
jgi:hypothetical protein